MQPGIIAPALLDKICGPVVNEPKHMGDNLFIIAPEFGANFPEPFHFPDH